MDDNFYTHYFILSTVEANWDLGSLGRGDTSKTLANVFKFTASVTGYKNIGLTSSPELALLNLTKTIPGPLNPKYYAPYLVPNTSATGGGRMHLCLSTYGHGPLAVPSVVFAQADLLVSAGADFSATLLS